MEQDILVKDDSSSPPTNFYQTQDSKMVPVPGRTCVLGDWL